MQDVTRLQQYRKRHPALYVAIPYPLLLLPPIAHRGSTASRRVAPFEFFTLVAVLIEATAANKEAAHLEQFKEGGSYSATEQAYADQFMQDWREHKRRKWWGLPSEAPQRVHTFTEPSHKPAMKRPQAIRQAGRFGYRQKRKQLLRRRPADITVTFSNYKLLHDAGYSNAGKNLRRLPATLHRLCERVGRYPPPLIDWRRQGDQVQLLVTGKWLDKPYGRVPLPLPRNATAAALYLFLVGINPDSKRSGTRIGIKQLAECLGLPKGNMAQNLRRIWSALDLVNDIVKDLDHAKLLKLKSKIEMPARYEMDVDGDTVHFRSVSVYQQQQDLEQEREAAEQEAEEAEEAELERLREELRREHERERERREHRQRVNERRQRKQEEQRQQAAKGKFKLWVQGTPEPDDN
jgi:hypothetical protein